MAEPGTVCAYSNWGVALAGYIVERVSGQLFYDYVHENIFAPLGMAHTALAPDYSDNEWVASRAGAVKGYTTDVRPLGDVTFYLNIYPAGVAAGTIGDMLLFAKALAAKGASPLFEKAGTQGEMFSPSLAYSGTDDAQVCHGLWTHDMGVQTLGHGGNTQLFSANLIFDSASATGIVVMTNQNMETVYNTGLPQLVFGTMSQPDAYDGGADGIAGVYYTARTIRKGIGKGYSLMGLWIVSEDGSGGYTITLPGITSVEAALIGPDTLLITLREGGVNADVLARYSDTRGHAQIEMRYGNMVKADADVWAGIVAVALLGIALLWSAAVLIASLIRVIARRIRKRERVRDRFKKYQVLLSAAILLLPVNILIAANMMFSQTASAASLLPCVIASVVIAVLPVGYGILFAVRRKGLACSRLQKAAYVISLVMGLMVTYAVIALEMYML